MKKLHSILILTIIGLFYSCSEDILDIPNPNTPTSDTFWQTPDDALAGLNAAYHGFYNAGSWSSRFPYFRMIGGSDEATSNSPDLNLKHWCMFVYIDYNHSQNSNVWRAHYKSIFRTNQVLHYIDDIAFTDEDMKKDIIAQTKFLRGFYYFYLAVLYENVPLILELRGAGDTPEQNTYAQVMAQVIKDLSEAAEDLPPTRSNREKGRATKGAALAYLGKAYMQLGEWQRAKDAFHWLVEGEGAVNYGLVDNYRDNFKHTTENNIESVFEIQFSDAIQRRPGDDAGSGVATERAQFLGIKTIGWCDAQPRPWLIAEYKKETTANGGLDTRLRDNLFYPELQTDFPGEKIYGQDWSTAKWGTDCYFRKYQSDYYKNTEGNYNPINNRNMRYADVLLCYAECLAQLSSGAPPALAIECVNRVRQRTSVNLLPLESSIYADAVTTKEKFLERLQMERALELCFECVRWIDLKRWKLWDTPEGLADLQARDADFNNFVVGKHDKLPIPQSEIDNNSNLTQNPNY